MDVPSIVGGRATASTFNRWIDYEHSVISAQVSLFRNSLGGNDTAGSALLVNAALVKADVAFRKGWLCKDPGVGLLPSDEHFVKPLWLKVVMATVVAG